jgi:hypothetical protein
LVETIGRLIMAAWQVLPVIGGPAAPTMNDVNREKPLPQTPDNSLEASIGYRNGGWQATIEPRGNG